MPRLADLKKMLVEATNFQSVDRYFSDHFGEDRAFVARGRPSRHKRFRAVLAAAADGFFEKKGAAITNRILLEVPEEHFIHGVMLIEGLPANVMYFDDIEVGLLAIITGPGDHVSYLRISPLAVRPFAGGQPFAQKADTGKN
jgi:hypothetical protein